MPIVSLFGGVFLSSSPDNEVWREKASAEFFIVLLI